MRMTSLAALPWIHMERLRVGPLTVPTQGLCAVVGLVVGYVLWRRSRGSGATPFEREQLSLIALICALLGGHALGWLAGDGVHWRWRSILIHQASLGAIVGGLTGLSAVSLLLGKSLGRVLDAAALPAAAAWVWVRLGCVLVHDHLGRASTSWLAVGTPTGPRLDIALLEWLWLWPLLAWLTMHRNRPTLAGRKAGQLLVAFAVLRTPLEFLRQQADASPTSAVVANLVLLGGLACAGAWLAMRAPSRAVRDAGSTPPS